ncbi:MAG: hypothetical protein ACYC7D_04105 [Nitrososphaerales archaeon]
MSTQKPLFSIGVSLSTRLLEIGAALLFFVSSLLSAISSAYYIAVLFALFAVIFSVVYFRMIRFDFYEESLRILRRNTLLREVQYSSVKDIYFAKGTFSMPPKISLKLKDEERLGWIGNPMNKELNVDLLSWLKSKVT